MALRHRLRALALPSLLILAALVPGSAEAAFVTAVDVAVRPAEGSPWSKGTLFRGEGFQVGHTTSTGWAYGRAKGGAERCGWVLLSEINSTTRTDDTCGSPKSEALGDSEHVPGGGPSERWFVTCDSATLHGNYGGGPGQLRSPAEMVGRGAALGWRYTTGDGYAASVDGPTGTPRFILRSCISRTPPAGAPAPGPGPAPAPAPAPTPPPASTLIGPAPYRLLDEEILFERKRGRGAESSSTAQATGPVTVKRTRATVRIAPRNIVIANGLRGDRFESSGKHCQGWYFGTITRDTGAKHTGWVQKAGLRGNPRAAQRTCGQSLVDFRKRIGFVNAPFRSVTFRQSKVWTTTGSASMAFLRLNGSEPDLGDAPAPDCQLFMNYENGMPSDPVQGRIERLVFKSDSVKPTAAQTIGYRYTTADGNYALISVKFKSKGKVGVWMFVKRDCVVPRNFRRSPGKGRNGNPLPRSKVNTVYQPEIRICNGLKPSKSVVKLNEGPESRRIRRIKPCELPNAKTVPGAPAPDDARDGWQIGSLRP